MKKISFIIFIVLYFGSVSAQQGKHTIYVSSMLNPSMDNSIYIDFDEPDYTIWAKPDKSISWEVGYMYSLTDCFGLGIQADYEKIEFEDFYLGNVSANRLAYGVFFQTKYPHKAFHCQAGGYFNLGSIDSDEMDDDLAGMEYGLTLGPAYSFGSFEAALLFKPRFSYYFSDGLSPEASLILYPAIALKIAYTLNLK
jgi:hypothetical protein